MEKVNLNLVKAVVSRRYNDALHTINMLESAMKKPYLCDEQVLNDMEQRLRDELSCSIIANNLSELENEPYYKYTRDGCCYFVVDGITFEALQLVNMRQPKTGSDLDKRTLTSDICMPVCYHKDDEDDISEMHVINRHCWLFGAVLDDFDEYKPVATEFVNAAKAYIKEKGKDFLLKAQETKEEDDE